MAISPRSKGLGNIGSIVNRQRLASPTKPAPKPVAKMPVPKVAPKANPFAGGKTTTMAQRQATSPFRSATKPVAKVNPMTGQPAMPIPQVSPAPKPTPQPFNPQPTPQPSFEIRDTAYLPGRDYEVGGPGDPNMMTPGQNPFNPPGGYTPGLPYTPGSGPDFGAPMPMPGSSSGIVDLGNGMSIVPDFGGGFQPEVGISNITGFDENGLPIGYSTFASDKNTKFSPGMSNQPVNTPGGGIFGGNLPGMVGNAVGQGLGGMFGNMFGAPGQQALQTGLQGLGGIFGNMFGGAGPNNPNQEVRPGFDFGGNVSMPNQSDYDQLEGSGFNTNSSGSLFGGGGFANQ